MLQRGFLLEAFQGTHSQLLRNPGGGLMLTYVYKELYNPKTTRNIQNKSHVLTMSAM